MVQRASLQVYVMAKFNLALIDFFHFLPGEFISKITTISTRREATGKFNATTVRIKTAFSNIPQMGKHRNYSISVFGRISSLL